MTTMTLTIKREHIRAFQEEVKHFGVKHGPFRKQFNSYVIDILAPESAHSFFLLKYGV